MSSVSKAQAKLMRAVAHSKEFAAKVDIPQSVGREFNRADQEHNRKRTIRKAFAAINRRG